MISVTLAPEPQNFDREVRQKGHNWLRKNGIDPNASPPNAENLPTHWRNYNKALWVAYSGVCAYLAIYFEIVTGASSTDHFVAKSRHAGQAYEWSNYRLACLGANRCKNRFDDVLDPIGLRPNTFHINFLSGAILPNPALTANEKSLAQKTIDRLKLDAPDMREMRARHYTEYLKHECTLNFLQRKSPFVYTEIVRQGLQLAGD